MALYSIASDLQTRGTVWVGINVSNLPKWNGEELVAPGKGQANSHTRSWESDGLPAAELAEVHTDYQGWSGPGHRYYCNPEARRISFPA